MYVWLPILHYDQFLKQENLPAGALDLNQTFLPVNYQVRTPELEELPRGPCLNRRYACSAVCVHPPKPSPPSPKHRGW